MKSSWKKPRGDHRTRRERAKKFFLGGGEKKGFIAKSLRYYLLTVVAFVFMYPIIYMVTRSFMSSSDLIDTTTKWLPSAISLKNYQHAWVVMQYAGTLGKTLLLTGVSTLLQVVVCCTVGYGFARYEFPLKKLWICLLLLSYLLPAQTTAVPNYILFKNLQLIDGSIKPFVVTAALGQGVYSALCILVFYSFHRQIPRSLPEAAEIDGANHLRIYVSIAVPMALAGVVVVTLFSFVWYWNETYLVNTYLGYGGTEGGGLTTLMIQLTRFDQLYGKSMYSSTPNSPDKINDAYRMAGTMLSILPLLVLYGFMQKKFVLSIDGAGITGE